jgi:nicotinamide-nucleotide amidase
VHETRVVRRILTAELLSIGSELTVGETRDTNAGELARSLTEAGVAVGRLTGLPDRLEVVAEAFATALARSDLVVSTGGLGPTPDDLTREAIAQVVGEAPVVDPDQERWLRALWARRRLPFPEVNLKQAWLIPSATALSNPNGTAPGWLVDRPDGRLIVALPGPPREMRPMWHDEVLPRLTDRGLGVEVVTRVYRLTGIGESQVAEILGDGLLRARNPEVATYARAEAVDVRISALGGPDADGVERTAAELAAMATDVVEARLGDHVWAHGDTTWSGAIGAELTARGWRLAVVEIDLGGQFARLLGDVPWLAFDESMTGDTPAALAHPVADDDDTGEGDAAATRDALAAAARRAGELAGAEVGVAVRAREHGADTAVSVAVVTPDGVHHERRIAFLGGETGRSRAALAAASILLTVLRATGRGGAGGR